MDAVETPLITLTDDEQIEFNIDLPHPEEYVPCDQCESTVQKGQIISNRSYMFFWFKDGLLNFCKHHGEKNQAKLEEQGGSLVMDTRDRLIENRLMGAA